MSVLLFAFFSSYLLGYNLNFLILNFCLRMFGMIRAPDSHLGTLPRDAILVMVAFKQN